MIRAVARALYQVNHLIIRYDCRMGFFFFSFFPLFMKSSRVVYDQGCSKSAIPSEPSYY